jgi:hypothetical protein
LICSKFEPVETNYLLRYIAHGASLRLPLALGNARVLCNKYPNSLPTSFCLHVPTVAVHWLPPVSAPSAIWKRRMPASSILTAIVGGPVPWLDSKPSSIGCNPGPKWMRRFRKAKTALVKMATASIQKPSPSSGKIAFRKNWAGLLSGRLVSGRLLSQYALHAFYQLADSIWLGHNRPHTCRCGDGLAYRIVIHRIKDNGRFRH